MAYIKHRRNSWADALENSSHWDKCLKLSKMWKITSSMLRKNLPSRIIAQQSLNLQCKIITHRIQMNFGLETQTYWKTTTFQDKPEALQLSSLSNYQTLQRFQQ